MDVKELFFLYHKTKEKSEELKKELVEKLSEHELLKNADKYVDSIDFWVDGFEIKGSLWTGPDETQSFKDEFKFVDGGFRYVNRKFL